MYHDLLIHYRHLWCVHHIFTFLVLKPNKRQPVLVDGVG